MTSTAFMNKFYKQQIEKLKSQLDNETCKNKANLLNREIANYEKALNKSAAGVDKYLK